MKSDWSAADAVVCLTNPADPNNSFATANRLFEAMLTGRPILVSKGSYLEEFTERLAAALGPYNWARQKQASLGVYEPFS